MNESKSRAEADAVADIVRKSADAAPIILEHPRTAEKLQVVALPQAGGGIGLLPIKKFFDEWLEAPERRKGTAALGDLESFVAHVKRFADTDSAIFASPTPGRPRLTAVLNYHRAGPEGAPRFGDHRAIYDFPLSDEWIAWSSANGKAMAQKDFAEFVENHLVDVIYPDAAELGELARTVRDTLGMDFATPQRLLELSKGLSLRVGVNAKNVANLATGEVQIVYGTEHTDERGAPLKVPTAALLAIPVWRGGERYQVPARIRYTFREGVLTWRFELHGTDRMFQHAFEGAKKTAKDATGIPLFVGDPE